MYKVKKYERETVAVKVVGAGGMILPLQPPKAHRGSSTLDSEGK